VPGPATRRGPALCQRTMHVAALEPVQGAAHPLLVAVGVLGDELLRFSTFLEPDPPVGHERGRCDMRQGTVPLLLLAVLSVGACSEGSGTALGDPSATPSVSATVAPSMTPSIAPTSAPPSAAPTSAADRLAQEACAGFAASDGGLGLEGFEEVLRPLTRSARAAASADAKYSELAALMEGYAAILFGESSFDELEPSQLDAVGALRDAISAQCVKVPGGGAS